MSCILQNGWNLDCLTVGGNEFAYLGTYSPNAAYTYNADDVITGATSASSVYLYSQEIESLGFEQTSVINKDNGSIAFEMKLTLKFLNIDKNLRKTLMALSKAPIFSVVKLNSGEHIALGIKTPLRASEGMIGSGVKFDDFNGATLTLSTRSTDGFYIIDPTLIGTSIPVM
jgi:hypothetical protein